MPMQAQQPSDRDRREGDLNGAARLLAEWVMMPVAISLSGVEAMVRVIRQAVGIQERRVDENSTERVRLRETAAIAEFDPDCVIESRENLPSFEATREQVAPYIPKMEKRMPDTNLSGEDLKLVRYRVLFIKRDYEHVFREQDELLHDDLRSEDFTSWKIAEFIQDLQKNDTEKRGEHKIPKKWTTKQYPPAKYNHDGYLLGFPEEDKKHLRLYFEVLQRYPREEFKYKERQIEVLEQIRDKMPLP